MLKHLKKLKPKKDICARTGCNNQIKRERNGTELNYCSTSCQMSHYVPGSSEFDDDTSPYTSTSSNQWGVWTPNQEDAPPPYASVTNENDLFGSIDDVKVTPLWETDDDPPSKNSRYSSSKPEEDFPQWVGSNIDPLWTPRTPRRTTLGSYSPPVTPRASSPSDEEEIQCPACTFFIRPNKTVCEMCGTSITRQEQKKSYNKSSSKTKPKSTITSYRDLYEEEEEEEEDDDPPPRRNNQSSSSRSGNQPSYSSSNNYRDSSSRSRNQSSYSSQDNHRDSSSSKSRNQYSDNYRNSSSRSRYNSSSDNDDNDDNYGNSYSQPRNKSSRNRTSNDNNFSSYQTSTPPSDGLWIDEDEPPSYSQPRNKSSRNRASGLWIDEDEPSSYSQPRNKSSRNRASGLWTDEDEPSPYSQPRNKSSRNRTSNNNNFSSHQTSTPPSDGLWIDEDEPSSYSQPRNKSSRNRTSNDNNYSSYQTSTPPSDGEENFFESTPSRRTTRQRPPPPPKPYKTPSFFKDPENRPKRNVQRPPTPPKEQITCPACNFDNHKSMTHCEICYTQLNKVPEKHEEKKTNFSRVETRAKKACKSCSYYNDADSVQCEMCYLPMEARRSFFTLPSFFGHDVDLTQCPSCTFMNHNTMVQCEVCGKALPGANLTQQLQQYQQICENAPGPITRLTQLPLNNHDYMTVQQKFKTGVPNANILAIFKVIMPARIIKAHEAYQKQIAGNNPIANVTHEMFHGSHVACDAKRFYGPPGWKYCNAADCGLCGITQNGNSCAKSKYGGRMWFANNSGTSLGYCRTDPIKAMFVQEIISAAGGAIIIVDKEAATLVKFLIIFQ